MEGNVIKTAKQILTDHATKAHDGLMTGQQEWILEAMWEFAKQEKDMAYQMGYGDGMRDGTRQEREIAMAEIDKYR